MSTALDRIFLSLMTLLILATPFAIGSVPPKAYSLMETGIFLLVVVWMIKEILVRREGLGVRGDPLTSEGGKSATFRSSRLTPDASRLTFGVLPLTLFIALVLFQLVPLPPSVMRIISPHTYEFYSKIFYGWPEQPPYADLPVTAVRGEGLGVRGDPNPKPEIAPDASRLTPNGLEKSDIAANSTNSIDSINAKNATNSINATNAIDTANAAEPEISARASRGVGAVRGEGLGVRGDPNPQSEIPPVPPTSDLRPPTSNASSATSASPLTPDASRGFTATWLPLSVAPYLTRIDLLKLIAYGALFFLILRYPYGAAWERGNTEPSPLGNLSPDQRLMRWIVFVVLGSGFLVAFVGFIQRFTWNGKILWFYEPYGAIPPAAGVITRASGPFVNPDHFANYLALVLPLALACTLFRSALAGKDWQLTLKILAGCTAFLIFTSILLSLSRGALVAVCAGIAVLVWLMPWEGKRTKRKSSPTSDLRSEPVLSQVEGTSSPPSASPLSDLSASAVNPNPTSDLRPRTASHQLSAISHSLRHPLAVGRLSVVLFCALLIVGLYFAGPSGRDQMDARLGERFVDEVSLGGRSQIWRDSPKVIADFPSFGVGLGAWPEVFLRYRTDPWALNFFREAHNDYVQLLSEAGLAGFVFFAWFIFAHGRRLVGGLKNISSRYLPLVVAMIAALAGMALHEWFDFSLKIPANAFLFIVLFAFALRAVTSVELASRQKLEVRDQSSEIGNQADLRPPSSDLRLPISGHARFTRVAPYAVILIAVVLAAQALRQNPIPYPFNLGEAESLAEAKENVLIFPTNALYHQTVLSFMGDNPPLAWQLRAMSAALWLEPANPYFRDRYAAVLFKAGRTDEGLREITRSVFNAPELGLHPYLDQEALPQLPVAQQAAIEEGFRQALARRSPGVVDGLAEVYARLGRFTDQAALYEWAAAIERDKGKKVDFALRAGSAFAKAGDFPKAERILSDAISGNRSDPRPYQYLIRDIYGAKKDLLGAQQAVAEGLRNGAPALDLNLALAEAARKAESPDEVETALAAAKTAVTAAAKEQYPFDLYIQLAEGAGKVGAHDEELAALLAALELQPTDTDTLSRVANVYLGQRNPDRAVIYLERLANIQYNSADVYFRLAQAEDARYRYAAAGSAYARAVELAPDNKNYQTTYATFKQKIAQNLPKPKTAEQGAANVDEAPTRVVQATSKELGAPSAKTKDRRAGR